LPWMSAITAIVSSPPGSIPSPPCRRVRPFPGPAARSSRGLLRAGRARRANVGPDAHVVAPANNRGLSDLSGCEMLESADRPRASGVGARGPAAGNRMRVTGEQMNESAVQPGTGRDDAAADTSAPGRRDAPAEPRGPNLVEIFARTDHDHERLHALVADGIARAASRGSVAYNDLRGSQCEIDLGGATFVLDRPLEISSCQLVTLRNGTLVAGPAFPSGAYLIAARAVTAVSFVSLYLECAKRANGIHLEDFFRVRIEDCHVIHQREQGIHASAQGNNHELEVLKCHVAEFLFWDGYPERTSSYGIIPAFDVDANRVSTGIFLGQADNVVADCNINLCRVGIHCGMRANRITGNHITGGRTKDLEIYKAIEANTFHKSSAIISQNYIDNCALWINCDDNARLNARNYLHVTDNLFYRGYNHPSDGTPWSHIVVNALKPGSKLGNVHICDNLFYNQDRNLNGMKPRLLDPLRVHTRLDP
jgi:hypothetical protein